MSGGAAFELGLRTGVHVVFCGVILCVQAPNHVSRGSLFAFVLLSLGIFGEFA
jgi:hypothetical protein